VDQEMGCSGRFVCCTFNDQNNLHSKARHLTFSQAGIGAGNRIDYSCSRYDHSYPNVINANSRLSGSQTFEFKACSVRHFQNQEETSH
jgi:hypothetical protein